MNSYIGGEFDRSALEAFQKGSADLGDHYFPLKVKNLSRHFYETGTDSFAKIVTDIHSTFLLPVQVWFPAHYCLESILRLKNKLERSVACMFIPYYALDDLTTVQNTTNVVLVNHFNGYSPIPAKIAELQHTKKWIVIEDFVHAPFDIHLTKADYSFNSLRKIADTEVSVCYTSTSYTQQALTASTYYTFKKEAVDLKTEFFKTGNKALEEKYLVLFKKAEIKLLNKEIVSAQEAEIQKVKTTNWKQVYQTRESNFNFLSEKIQPTAKLEVLPGKYMYFVIKIAQRNELKSYLFSHDIFPVIHWPDSLDEISTQLLSLHIDQRYGHYQMQRIISLIEQFFKEY